MPKLRLNPISAAYHLVRNNAHELEYNPEVQWKFHRKMSWYWLVNFPIVATLFFEFPKIWVGVGLLLNTFYSLYANFSTDYGAIPASYAAMLADEDRKQNNKAVAPTPVAEAAVVIIPEADF